MIIVGKRDIRKLFVLPSSQLLLPWQNLLSSFTAPQPKANAPQPSTHAFPTKGNSSKNAKKKEHNVDKREVLQAHVVQVQTLQNELKSLRAQLVNLKASLPNQLIMPSLYRVQDHGKDLLGCSMAFHTTPWLGNIYFLMHTILVSHQNLPFFFAFPTSRHKRLVWHLEFLPLGR